MHDPRALARLRPAASADAAAIARLGRESFCAKFGHLYAPEDLAAFIAQAYRQDVVAGELADGNYLHQLAWDEDRLVAFCKLGLVSGFGHPAEHGPQIDLKQLYTDPARTGEGLGTLLTEWAIGEGRRRGYGEMLLSVWSGNVGAQRFYRRFGFRHVADIDFWVGYHRDDELLYALTL